MITCKKRKNRDIIKVIEGDYNEFNEQRQYFRSCY